MTYQWNEHDIERPEPVVEKVDAIKVTTRSRVSDVMSTLDCGLNISIDDFYSTGTAILHELKKKTFGKESAESFAASRVSRGRYRELSNRIFIPVEGNKIALKKAPEIGWLQRLYPDVEDFLLPLPAIQGLNSSWQWYTRGIRFPVLDFTIHPFYGVYFPTRFDHLELFEEWLKTYRGNKRQAVDMGAGCGVLSFQLLKRGFEMVHAADISPNALVSVAENAEACGSSERLVLHKSDLFERLECRADMVVFNPPWLPASEDLRGLDRAIYYEKDLFERFFESAVHYITDRGIIVLLFSNMAEKEAISDVHPVRRELSRGGRFVCIEHRRKKVRRGSVRTKRRSGRNREFVELWVLGRKRV